MINDRAPATIFFRLIVMILAAFYLIEGFFYIEDWSAIGWQFRFLTNWGLAMSLASAYFMWAYSTGRRATEAHIWASVTVVMNVLVVYLYWSIYLADPTNFYEDGVPIDWWREYYLHLVGPILQWIDAFFIMGAFRNWKKIAGYLIGLVIAYPVFIEGVVAPLNATPVGRVTNGLPYLFLNHKDFVGRLEFYGTTIIGAVIVFGICVALAWALRRAKIS